MSPTPAAPSPRRPRASRGPAALVAAVVLAVLGGLLMAPPSTAAPAAVPAADRADGRPGACDPDNAGLVMDALADAAAEGRTVVVATHDPAVVARADEVVRL